MQKQKLVVELEKIESEEKEIYKKLKSKLNIVGNIIDDDVPIGDDEHKHNKVLTKWGKIPDYKIDGTPGNYHHHEVLKHLDGFD
jgi:seryl-tRNA synthetase